jgi:hypothetical protein
MAGSMALRTTFITIRMSLGAVTYTWGRLARMVR